VLTYILSTILAALSIPSLTAQNDTFAPGTVGIPYYVDLGSEFATVAQEVSQLGDGVSFTYSFAATNPPPGLSIDSSGIFSGTPTTAGSFSFTFTIHETLVALGTTYLDMTFPIPVVLIISGTASGGAPTVDPPGLVFTFAAGMTAAASQSLSVSNPSNVAKTFSASATTETPGSWLTVSPVSGNLAAFVASSIQVTVNPAGLGAGAYTGLISVNVSSGESFDIPVDAIVGASGQIIDLSEDGLRFQVVQGGGAPPAETIEVFNDGTGTLSFSASASTASGGAWLAVSPAKGTATLTTSTELTVTVNPAGLAPGDYYGQIDVASDSVEDSPETVTVVLNVNSPAKSPGLQLSTTGLVFVATAKGANPAAKSVALTNPSPQPVKIGATTISTTAGIFGASPSSTTVNTAQPVTVQIQPNISGLAPGQYTGELDISGGDGSFRRVALLLVVTPAAGSSRAKATIAACTPQKLTPLFTQLGSGFSVAAGWPVPLELTVVDDCGNYFTGGGSVIASFTSGDPAVSLTSLKDGRWVATWQPHVPASQVTITAKASAVQPPLQGTAQLGGAAMPNPAVPVIGAGGVVSAASYAKRAPIAPGGFISIFGTSLSAGTFVSSQLPLAMHLGGTQVTLGGKPLPLLITNGGQINAVLPYDVPPNSIQQLVVQNNSAISLPEPVTIAAGAPGVFALNQQGSGAGIIVDYPPNGPFFQVDGTHPASAGDVLVIYCAGLGPVNPPVTAGTAAPSSPPAVTVNPVTVTIGGMQTPVSFSGLSPGFTGLYQINTVVPAGLSSGNQPVVIKVAGQQSPPVTLNVR